MSIKDKAQAIYDDIEDIAIAINTKGGSVTGKPLSDYAGEINSLPLTHNNEWYELYVKELHDSKSALSTYGKITCLIRTDEEVITLPSGFYYEFSDNTTDTTGTGGTKDFAGAGIISGYEIPFRWVIISPISSLTGAVNTIPSLTRSMLAVVSEVNYTSSLDGTSSTPDANYNFMFQPTLRYIYLKKYQVTLGGYVFKHAGLRKIEADYPINTTSSRQFEPLGIDSDLEYLPSIASVDNTQAIYGYLKVRSLTFTFTTSTASLGGILYYANQLQWLNLPTNFNCDGLNISYSIYMSAEALVDIANHLKDLSAESSKSIVLGATLIAKLTTAQLLLFSGKNWVVT